MRSISCQSRLRIFSTRGRTLLPGSVTTRQQLIRNLFLTCTWFSPLCLPHIPGTQRFHPPRWAQDAQPTAAKRSSPCTVSYANPCSRLPHNAMAERCCTITPSYLACNRNCNHLLLYLFKTLRQHSQDRMGMAREIGDSAGKLSIPDLCACRHRRGRGTGTVHRRCRRHRRQ